MRFYNQQHRFYCGVDLHARSMFTHVLDQQGKTLFEKDLPACPDTFRDAIRHAESLRDANRHPIPTRVACRSRHSSEIDPVLLTRRRAARRGWATSGAQPETPLPSAHPARVERA